MAYSPPATLAQAFQSLVRQLLSKSDAELRQWRQALLEALGANGQLMVNFIPGLALTIGEQPPIPARAAGPVESVPRVFGRFLGVFARPEHPVALDAATLQLLEHILTEATLRHLLLVGAYRDNEVCPAHQLTRSLGLIRDAGVRVRRSCLRP